MAIHESAKFDASVLGRYQYVFSSPNKKHIVFNVTPYFDADSKQWFGKFHYDFCSYDGYDLAIQGDELEKIGFWRRNPAAHVRETYYELRRESKESSTLVLYFQAAEYLGNQYRVATFEIRNVDTTQFAVVERMLHSWHSGSALHLGSVVIELSPWQNNPYYFAAHKIQQQTNAERSDEVPFG